MLLVLSLIMAIFTNAEAKFSVQDSVSILGGLDTNPLFLDASSSQDYLVRVDPKADLIYDINSFYAKVGGGVDYNKYFKNTGQSFLKWNFDSLISIKPEEFASVDIINNYDNNSDPILMTTEDRAKWTLFTSKAAMHYVTKSNLWKVDGEFESYTKQYESATFQNFDNNKRYFTIKTKFYFFPETALMAGFKGGYSFYTAGYNTRPYGNSDSEYAEAFVGLDGQFTSNMNMFLKVGFLSLNYQHGTCFHEPVVQVTVTDFLSKLSSVSAIYERMAYDSVYSNFYVDNKISLETKNIWYDNFVSLSTFQYIYRYYRLSPRRLDHRLAFTTETAIPVLVMNSIKENVSFFVRFLAEWVNSDAYNSFGFYNGPDPAASYKRFVLMAGFTTKY